ncbi:MAG: multicopper oxidase family protein, partial [Gemmatimonadaceae bacterium]
MTNRLMLLTVLTLSGSVGPLSAQPAHKGSRAAAHEHIARDNPPSREDTVSGRAVLVNNSKVPKTVEVNLTAALATMSLQPGVASEVFAYNGRVPGPTLDVREGDKVIVHFRNDLPEATTVHWHGIHLPFESDGSPFHPIKPGETHDYVFTVRPGTAGTYWYHPHPDHRAGYAIGKGLFGGIIVRAADDPLPASMPDKLLILSDNRFLADGSIDFPDPHAHHAVVDESNGREGPVLFVNGQVMPTIRIRSGEVQRWRVLNASAGRMYRLALSGHTFLQVGSDGGLFEKPVEVKEILLTTGERVELLVRGSDAPGGRSVLRNLPYDRYVFQTRPRDWETTRDLLTLETTNETPVTPVAIPATLRRIPPLDTMQVSAVRTVTFSQGLINGKLMDM